MRKITVYQVDARANIIIEWHPRSIRDEEQTELNRRTAETEAMRLASPTDLQEINVASEDSTTVHPRTE